MVSLRSFALTRNQRLMPKKAKKQVAKQAKVEPGHSESSQVQHEAPEATPSRLDDLESMLKLRGPGGQAAHGITGRCGGTCLWSPLLLYCTYTFLFQDRPNMPLQELGDLEVLLSKLRGFGPLGRAVSEHIGTCQDQCKLEGARASDVGTTNVTATERNTEGWRCHCT
ncbi:hypothetical protein BS47DRAFT_285599 [Hydnum rufescens UP504]|uniref:Uncharacterized protein n=1 Tax=Hydnum rufescens UP504 TaxID=1448309 RepID=A0A9P6AKK6_9AGAM|nr:hypothetical protein BS47DRAFT_285599 [Hydnum rufescens UP504]